MEDPWEAEREVADWLQEKNAEDLLTGALCGALIAIQNVSAKKVDEPHGKTPFGTQPATQHGPEARGDEEETRNSPQEDFTNQLLQGQLRTQL